MARLWVEVVSAHGSVYSGWASFVALPGESGELGILPHHVALITRIKPGAVRIHPADGATEVFIFVAGGILEVQPGSVVVLADTAIRSKDADDARALLARQVAQAEAAARRGAVDYQAAHTALLTLTAQATAYRLRRK